MYKTLKSIPSSIFINPKVDAFSLIENAELVFSMGGTISLEAAFMGKRALTASKLYFSEVMMRDKVNPYDIENSEMNNILNEELPDYQKLIEFLAKIHANSYIGMFQDPTIANYGSDENINNIYTGFKDFLINKLYI